MTDAAAFFFLMVQHAVLTEATRLEAQVTSTRAQIRHDGAWRADDALSAAAVDSARTLRPDAQVTVTAAEDTRRGCPSDSPWWSGSFELTLRGSLHQALQLNLKKLLNSSTVKERCRFAPLTIYINGRRIPQSPLGAPREPPPFSAPWTLSGFCITPDPAWPDNPEIVWTPKRHHVVEVRYFGTDMHANLALPSVTMATNRLLGRADGRLTSVRQDRYPVDAPCHEYLALLAEINYPSEIAVVFLGVAVETIQFHEKAGVLAALCADSTMLETSLKLHPAARDEVRTRVREQLDRAIAYLRTTWPAVDYPSSLAFAFTGVRAAQVHDIVRERRWG